MTTYALDGVGPSYADGDCWIAPSASVVGDVRFGKGCSVWFGAVIRCDNEPIEIGDGSNVQDNAVLHSDPGFPLNIGSGVVVGHQAMVHGCTIGDNCLIGIGATMLNGAKISDNCVVGANALVTEGKVFEKNSLIVGAPAHAIRTLTDEQVKKLTAGAVYYVENAKRFKKGLKKITD